MDQQLEGGGSAAARVVDQTGYAVGSSVIIIVAFIATEPFSCLLANDEEHVLGLHEEKLECPLLRRPRMAMMRGGPLQRISPCDNKAQALPMLAA